jgi:hypothetical protein
VVKSRRSDISFLGEADTFGGLGEVGVEIVIVPVCCFVEGAEEVVEDVEHQKRPSPVCRVMPP